MTERHPERQWSPGPWTLCDPDQHCFDECIVTHDGLHPNSPKDLLLQALAPEMAEAILSYGGAFNLSTEEHNAFVSLAEKLRKIDTAPLLIECEPAEHVFISTTGSSVLRCARCHYEYELVQRTP